MIHGTRTTGQKRRSSNSTQFFWRISTTSGTLTSVYITLAVRLTRYTRIDRLASIILNEHLPFFRYFETPNRPTSKAIIELNQAANRVWERDMVQATPGHVNHFTVSRVEYVLAA